MSKRSSATGNSPTPKTQRPTTSSQKSGSSQPFEDYLENSFSFLDDNSESLHDPQENECDPPDTEYDLPDTDPPDTESNPLTPAPTNPSSQESQLSFSFLDSQPRQSQRGPEHLLLDDHGGAPCDGDGDEALSIASNVWSPLNYTNNTDKSASQPDAFAFDHQNTEATLEDILAEHIAKGGLRHTADIVLGNKDLKKEIMRIIFQESHSSLKLSLKKSKLCADKKDRNFLLSLSPRSLCEEFQLNSSPAFLLLVHGMLGISDPDSVFTSQYLLNNIVFMYSTISKVINRKATSYALLMTSSARDGGMREDTLKLFSMFVHPRTSQKYDREVLAKDWDQPLVSALQSEKEHFTKLHNALKRRTEIDKNDTASAVEIEKEIKHLLETVPPQLQQVWDNLNLRQGFT